MSRHAGGYLAEVYDQPKQIPYPTAVPLQSGSTWLAGDVPTAAHIHATRGLFGELSLTPYVEEVEHCPGMPP